jgi:hypothetical protein
MDRDTILGCVTKFHMRLVLSFVCTLYWKVQRKDRDLDNGIQICWASCEPSAVSATLRVVEGL